MFYSNSNNSFRRPWSRSSCSGTSNLKPRRRLIDDLLDVSRINSGKLELKREHVQIQTVLEHAVEASRPLLDHAEHELITECPGKPIWLNGDLVRLAQVVSNLLNNSAKYTPDHGRILLSVVVEGQSAVIRITDNGGKAKRRYT